jgi:acetoin utilization deacetylase AcuC-like enzyme
MLARLTDALRAIKRRRRLPIWYDVAYRLPLPAVEAQAGVEPRRADLVVWYLLDRSAISTEALRAPARIGYAELARVHTPEHLESLSRPETLARIYAVDPSEVSVNEVMDTVRLACGATLEAARTALETRGPALNLLGGFHHAAPDHGGGLCPVNDIAVAVATLRHEGFAGRVAVLDCDAHPPDGTAACLRGDAASWIGSLSGSDWGRLEGVDEVLLPEHTGDTAYLAALDGLLERMPRPQLAFVIAGGDVLAGDRMGRLGMTLAGARTRDLLLLRALDGIASVWLPGGGYSHDSWKALAGTALALLQGSRRPITDDDPLRGRFAAISAGLQQQLLRGDLDLSEEDIEVSLGVRPSTRPMLLGYYTTEGIEYALFRFGLLDFLQRLGYHEFRLAIEPEPSGGDRVHLHGRADGREWLLVDLVLERRLVEGRPILYVHWLSLRNPRAQFGDRRPQMPGQEVPGLGLAREVSEILSRIAERLGLEGVAFRPAWYHTAYAGRHHFRFVDPVRQGRFEALQRDLASLPLLEASLAIADGRVSLDGRPYSWEADEMIFWLEPHAQHEDRVAAERERVRFTVAANEGHHG